MSAVASRCSIHQTAKEHFEPLLQAGNVVVRGRRAILILVIQELADIRGKTLLSDVETRVYRESGLADCDPTDSIDGEEPSVYFSWLFGGAVDALTVSGICTVTENSHNVQSIQLNRVLSDFIDNGTDLSFLT
ncbi:hypothetical protein [Roseibium alexandrii]|uniref:Uncharacterized protein n=1 Tax=Roseibium alexandrii (strain DSM 17067 / NCIMB 14079 / DFL-11) TaxID=244592 RepID=A0A5E8H740_ROSAD|nr:hypothetical protein [Roseibium alexandrii]EEE47902.1 hypothetical protein SADFL11_5192 [Roseibium alexandrii DFL-11]